MTSSVVDFESWSPNNRAKLSGWIRDQNRIGELPTLSSYVIPQIIELSEKSVAERTERLLSWAVSQQRRLGNNLALSHPSAIAATYSIDEGDVYALAQYLREENLIRSGSGVHQVTARGFMKVGTTLQGPSANGFIAMSFDSKMFETRQALENVVRASGYMPVIVNNVEHVNKIDDEIISQIRKARFLVADFTGHRGGVYFEAGFAMGIGLPVFWTCNIDEMKELHFDVRQYNCIDWKNAEDLGIRLRRRIEAVIGPGAVLVAS